MNQLDYLDESATYSSENGDGSILLFVDDEKKILDSFRRATRRERYHVIAVESAAKALRFAKL